MQLDAATATLIGVAITAFFGAVVTGLNLWYTQRQQREQWERQERKEQLEYERRIKESISTDQAKLKDKLQDLYADGIQTLASVLVAYSAGSLQPRIDNIRAVQKALALITIYHYDREDGDFKDFLIHYRSMVRGDEIDTNSVEQLRQTIINFSLKDPRLK